MKRICVLTATRAEYGLLLPVIRKLMESELLEVKVVVTGTHLSPEFGMTIKEIENDGISIDERINILLSSDTPNAISKTMGLALISFADYFEKTKPDALLVLGDRYETLAVCCAAMNEHIPIFHMCGGETTEGAVDEAIRHSITKMSFLHFTTTEMYRRRVIQLGEDPSRVFWVGSTGVENAKNVKTLSRDEIENKLGFKLGEEYAVATYHPVTLEKGTAQKQINEILNAVEKFPNIIFLFTGANADADGRIINELLERESKEKNNIKFVYSLGMVGYFSAVKGASFVLGNSSSGVGEVPALGIPTINIGDRQKGRIIPKSVVNCEPNCESIVHAINRVRESNFREYIQNIDNPYGKGDTSKKVAEIIEKMLSKDIEIKKKFYNL